MLQFSFLRKFILYSVRQGVWLHYTFGKLSILNKVDVPNSITYLNRTRRFEWDVVRCGFKNKYQKVMCLLDSWTMCS